MVSAYHGIETGKTALSYFRKNMEIAGINTSKAKEEGYSRQTVVGEAKDALITGRSYSMLGTGVEITAIERMRDQFLDARVRRASVDQVYWSVMEKGMARVETMVRGSNDASLNKLLDNFWASVEDVHKFVNEAGVRGAFLEEADTLAQFVKTVSNNYSAYRTELNDDIRSMVEEANSIIDQLAVLNRGISMLENSGAEPNALLDKRDLLVDRLCVLTGARATVSDADMRDGDFKVDIDGKIVVQGTKTRHLMLVENPTNNGYYEVQVEYDQYDLTSNPDAVGVIIEQRADDTRETNGTCTMDAFHQIEVVRTADEMYWQVGHALSDKEGAQRMTGLKPDTQLGIDGSFALSVGSAGVRAYSKAFASNPPGEGVILGPVENDVQTDNYEFKIAAGNFETTIKINWNKADGKWEMSDSWGKDAALADDTQVSIDDLVKFFNASYAGETGITASRDGLSLVLDSRDRQVMSIEDMSGDLMRSSGLVNSNPVVLIDVKKDDTLQSIANKINNAYKFDKIVQIEGEDESMSEKRLLFYDTVPADTAPSSPEQWMHASVELDASGEYFLLLTSNVAGEANRINVMSGSVCGDVNDMTVARLLGLVADGYDDVDSGKFYDGRSDLTSYVQFDASTSAVTDRYTINGDVFVDDAYVILDGKKEFLSAENMFRYAREVAPVGNAPTDERVEFSPGMRVQVNGVGTSDIIVRHHLISGEIYATLKLRDDMLLAQMDTMDEMIYEFATQFNAMHYAGYGMYEYADVTGMKFYEEIAGRYGAFSKLDIDDAIISDEGFDHSRLAAMSGDGSGHAIGEGDGSNALAMAQLKQTKLFMSGTCDFNDYYLDFVTQYASFGKRSQTMLKNASHIVEQIEKERQSVMGVNIDEEMLNITEMNQQFNYTSRYLTTLLGVMDQIITGLGRVGL